MLRQLNGCRARAGRAKHGDEYPGEANRADENAHGDCPIPEETAVDHGIAARPIGEIEHDDLVPRAVARRIAADAVFELDRLVRGRAEAHNRIVSVMAAA